MDRRLRSGKRNPHPLLAHRREQAANGVAHGSSDDGLCWTNLAKEFQNDFDIIMFDARGHGLSNSRPLGSAGRSGRGFAGLIKELKLNKPILMGHSMGSASVAHFAAKYPDVPRR